MMFESLQLRVGFGPAAVRKLPCNKSSGRYVLKPEACLLSQKTNY